MDPVGHPCHGQAVGQRPVDAGQPRRAEIIVPRPAFHKAQRQQITHRPHHGHRQRGQPRHRPAPEHAGAHQCRRQQQRQEKGGQSRGAAGGAFPQEHAHSGGYRRIRPAQMPCPEHHPSQQQPHHQPAEGVGVAVPEGGAIFAHPLADHVRGHNARKVQRQHHRHGGGSGGEKRPQRPA